MLMDIGYINAVSIMEDLRYKLKKILSTAPVETVENTEAYRALENTMENLEDNIKTIKYFSKEARAGALRELDNGKYEIHFNDGAISYPLSCGSSLEVYINDVWIAGRVEHSNSKGGYYLHDGEENPALYQGLKVRKRGE